MTTLPDDSIILLSYLNTQLRDKYHSLDELVDDMDISAAQMDEIVEKLGGIGYSYSTEKNQFI